MTDLSVSERRDRPPIPSDRTDRRGGPLRAAGSRGAAIVFVDGVDSVTLDDIIAGTAKAGPPIVVGDAEAVSDAVVAAVTGLEGRPAQRSIRR